MILKTALLAKNNLFRRNNFQKRVSKKWFSNREHICESYKHVKIEKKNVIVQNSKYEFKIIKNQRFSWVRESSAQVSNVVQR